MPSPEPEAEPELEIEKYDGGFMFRYEDDFEDDSQDDDDYKPEIDSDFDGDFEFDDSYGQEINNDFEDNLSYENYRIVRVPGNTLFATRLVPKEEASNPAPAPLEQDIAAFTTTVDNTPFSYHNEEERKTQEQRAYGRLNKLRGLISIEATKCTVFTDLSSNIFEPFQSVPSNMAHAMCQTGKECSSEEVQTESAESEEKETQMPHVESVRDEEGAEKERTPADRARFKKFFFAATQTIREILIDDDRTAEEDETREKSVSKFSRGYNPFRLGNVVPRSKATCVQKGEADSVLVAFELFETLADDLRNKSLIVEFYVHKKRPPKRLFLVESVVSAMELSTASATLYVCLMDGAFCAFDLSATDAFFDDSLPWVESETNIVLRRPTFDSSFLSMTVSDATPLLGLTVSKSSIGEDVATIDSSGTFSYWVASRVEKNELKVLLTAVIRPHPVLKRHSNSFAVSAFCHVAKPLRFFVGTDTGILYSMYKSDTSQAMPKVFKTEKEKTGEVTVISANPSDNTVLLVGFSNGSVSIYRTIQTSALINIPVADLSTRVTWLTWSLTNPSGFYTIHNGNSVSYWDLGHRISPRSIDRRTDSASVLSACTWQSESATIAYVAFGLDNGDSEVHVLENPARKNANEPILEVLKRLKHL